jgi:DNA-3-methyladenine glycosylase II
MLPTKIKNFFKRVEPNLAIFDVRFHPTRKYFQDLCESIVCQQLSGKAAAAIWKKFKLLIGENNIKPAYIVTLDDAFLRTTGISWAKARYTKYVAQAFLDGTVTSKKFSSMTEEEIITQLVKIKGVGRWTAEMFLMFSLGREDVFSIGDLGLRKGMQKLLHMKTLPGEKIMKRMSKKWSPYRTYGALLLWRSLDTV